MDLIKRSLCLKMTHEGKTRTRSFSRIALDAEEEALKATGQALAQLMKGQATAMELVEYKELVKADQE